MQDNTLPPTLTVNTEPFPEVSPEMASSSPVSGHNLQRKKSFGQKVWESSAMPQNWGRKSVSDPPSPADPSSPNVPQSVFASHDAQNSLNAPVSTREATAKKRKSISKTSSQPATPTSTGSTSFTMPKSSLASPGAVDKLEKRVSIVEPSGEEQATAEISEPSAAPDQEPDADAAPTSPAQDQPRADPASIVQKETLRSAFDYTFSKTANIETAQQMFRDACADHVYRVNSYQRKDFISLLEEKLIWRPRYASPEFLQTFIRITAFVHQYVDPQLDQVIVKLFVTLKKDPKGIFASRVYPKENMLPMPFSNGLQALYIAHRDQRSTEGLPQPGWYVPVTDMELLAAFNRELFKTAAHKHVDAEKLLYNLEVSDLWKEFEQKKASRFNFCGTT